MQKFDINKLVRPHILSIKPYSSARDEFSGSRKVALDANENAFGTPGIPAGDYLYQESHHFNRYPDPYQREVKKRIGKIKKVSHHQIFLGNGSDEAIDLLIRAFCVPGEDNVMILPPTYGMYKVSADINNVMVKEVPLTKDYQLDPEGIKNNIDPHTKLLFICSPNNPTGNAMLLEDIEYMVQEFSGLVVVDEAYIDFSGKESALNLLKKYENLVVLQTLSKAWGMAALRLGIAFASPEIIGILNKIKPPYNVNELTQRKVLELLDKTREKNKMVKQIMEQKASLKLDLEMLDITLKVYPSDANFLLVKFLEARELYEYLAKNEIIVRDRSNVILCEDCLRITVGTPEENHHLIEALKDFQTNKKALFTSAR